MLKIQLKFLVMFVFLSSVDFVFPQGMHHQMLTSQSAVVIKKSGLVVSQSIGQLSMAGTYAKNGLIVQQGFQQSLKYVTAQAQPSSNSITTIVYPNPVNDYVNFQFSSPVKGEISIALFDAAGKFLRQQVFAGIVHTRVTLNALSSLPVGQYVILLTSSGYNFRAKLLKID